MDIEARMAAAQALAQVGEGYGVVVFIAHGDTDALTVTSGVSWRALAALARQMLYMVAEHDEAPKVLRQEAKKLAVRLDDVAEFLGDATANPGGRWIS